MDTRNIVKAAMFALTISPKVMLLIKELCEE